MKEKEFRRNMAVFPIGSVMKLTDLTARQIRYYEDQNLITPIRNEGNRRMYSLNDMDRLLEIKDYISEGCNIAAIKKKYAEREAKMMFVGLSIMIFFSKGALALRFQPLVTCVDHKLFCFFIYKEKSHVNHCS